MPNTTSVREPDGGISEADEDPVALTK
jgi:hypothetical protein